MKKKELCELAGVSPSTISKMGRNEIVSMEVVAKICLKLNCTVDDILEILPDDSENKMSVNEIRTRKISDTKILLLQDAKVYILENSEGYLEDLYGKSWRVPNPNWVNGSGPCCHKLNDIYGYYEKCIEK